MHEKICQMTCFCVNRSKVSCFYYLQKAKCP